MMIDWNGWLFLGAAGVLVVLIVPPLRAIAAWLIGSAIGPVFAGLKSVMHVILRAHANVLRNFQPRTAIYYQLNRQRTSHTEDR